MSETPKLITAEDVPDPKSESTVNNKAKKVEVITGVGETAVVDVHIGESMPTTNTANIAASKKIGGPDAQATNFADAMRAYKANNVPEVKQSVDPSKMIGPPPSAK